MELLVVGSGAMGRWLARTVDAPVAFADVDADAAREAAASLDDARSVPVDTGERFDAVCLAVPISAVRESIAAYAPRAERAMLDVTGVMTDPVRLMREHLPGRERVSLHPLFAPANAPGNVAVVRDRSGPVTDAVVDAIEAAGNHPFETTPAEHDTAMESVQAAAHTAVLAYALAAEDVREEFATPVSARLDELVDLVTGGSPRVYREIQASFPGADRVAGAAVRVAEAEGATFDELYREAGDGRRYGWPDAAPDGETDTGVTGEADAADGSSPDTDGSTESESELESESESKSESESEPESESATDDRPGGPAAGSDG